MTEQVAPRVGLGTLFHIAKRYGYVGTQGISEFFENFDDLRQETNVSTRSALEFLSTTQLASIDPPFDFVEGLLHDGQLSSIYGAPGTGKSFFVLDLAMCVAQGCKWNNRETELGGVLLIALEGIAGTRWRFEAHCKVKNITEIEAIPICFAQGALNLREDAAARKQIIDKVAELSKKWDVRVRWIIIDTLSRAMAGGDENSPADMGSLVTSADEIRVKTGAHVTLVHHSGKDQARGGRGHSCLLGSLDTEIEVKLEEKLNHRTVRITKQKDGEMGAVCKFKLVPVTLDHTDARGNSIHTPVVEIIGGMESVRDVICLGDRAEEAWAVLCPLLKEKASGSVPKAECKAALRKAGWSEMKENSKVFLKLDSWNKAFARAMSELIKAEFIKEDADMISLNSRGEIEVLFN